ncbi:GNAT family N-acetyltransferase [Micromonospora echinospora]|uniref:L-amino acid N-acyltransferase YncA n=1 Tax=Micromonospora echinospora TaxID=1877 RepID=A0A1C4YPN5_MICEC|nr:GNAT family N-acetyltransferase [Micromonospora echinospora]OZV73031.1 GNAT family N-acetyltransferase [Micromonospora echinospora]SCF22723.1 L-amino acid N-acyltransferase YncA [Micromonospora echinospora]
MLDAVLIRDATIGDWPRIWPFLREIVAAGETYTWPRDVTEEQARPLWMPPPPARTVVAVDPDGTVLGSAKLLPNQGGPGAHVANASFMVAPFAAGRGVGRALGTHVLDLARAEGYRGMQFNAVVSTNTRAVGLWRSLGFEVVGRIPEGFRLPDDRYVDLLVMYQRL